jgi:hypothetical protein
MFCKFCEAMKVNCQCDEFNQSPNELVYGKYMSEYTVAIVAHHWYSKMGKRTAGRTVDYRHMGLGYKLNYCPECGRKMEEQK